MTSLSPFWHPRHQNINVDVDIVSALEMWGSWYADISPLGTTGDYALDMLLADAFRALLYRPALKDRLDWIQREVRRPRRRPLDDLYHAEITAWFLDIWEAGKAPGIVSRLEQRRLRLCVS